MKRIKPKFWDTKIYDHDIPFDDKSIKSLYTFTQNCVVYFNSKTKSDNSTERLKNITNEMTEKEFFRKLIEHAAKKYTVKKAELIDFIKNDGIIYKSNFQFEDHNPLYQEEVILIFINLKIFLIIFAIIE